MTANIEHPLVREILINKAVMQQQGSISAEQELILVTFKSTQFRVDQEVLDLPNTQPAITVALPVQIPMPFDLIAECRFAVTDPNDERMNKINTYLSNYDGAFGGILQGMSIRINQVEWQDL